ncbi:MAG: hypothetical protein A3A82_03680 [Candidatus Pacebacteria bacterium RIFCSPLOWO2_01_FULL_47_12]|nr:MAG: hypothetical protein A3J60_04315 [Candidatus Pacebacteria bacterium RIFCSPHIGHO2_02_FULL_46_9]OGJ39177.1 MAG: hypothetical protein A3A82_03680 [Candidatus Pacebacteria bacterium RIFCSPLOWO2_01_FULL_47_12]
MLLLLFTILNTARVFDKKGKPETKMSHFWRYSTVRIASKTQPTHMWYLISQGKLGSVLWYTQIGL